MGKVCLPPSIHKSIQGNKRFFFKYFGDSIRLWWELIDKERYQQRY